MILDDCERRSIWARSIGAKLNLNKYFVIQSAFNVWMYSNFYRDAIIELRMKTILTRLYNAYDM